MFNASAKTIPVVLVFLLAGWPSSARAGWFVRDNQTAYRLAQEGHNHQALKYWDDSAEGLFGRGTALMHLGEMREAERAFRQSLAVAPHKTGFSDDLEMPVGRRPGFMASVWYNLGNALYAQGEFAEARQAWLTTLRFQPGHAKARHNLEVVDRLLGEREQHKQESLAGMNASKREQARRAKAQAESSQNEEQHTTQHGLLPFHAPDSSQQESSSGGPKGGKKSGAARILSMAGKKMQPRTKPPSPSHHHAAPHESRATTPMAGGGDQGQGGSSANGGGMSPRQAAQELRMVEEGVSVFLRHRLSEKSSQATTPQGDAW